MSGHRDDEDFRDSSLSGRGGHSSSLHGKDGKIDASKLGDMLVGDGRLFGVKMPQDTIDGIRKIIPAVLFMLTDKGQDLVTKHFNSPKAGKIAGVAIAFSEQIAETVQNFANLVSSLDNLHHTMKPAARAAGSASALTMNNEAIQDLRAKIISLFMHRMMDTVVGAIGAVPSLMLALSKSGEKSQKYAVHEEIQATKGDPNEIANVLEGQYHGGGKTGVNKGVTGAQIAEGEKMLIGRKLEQYTKEFNEFSTKNAGAVKESLTTSLKNLNELDYELQFQQMRKFGLPVDSLKREIDLLKNKSPQQRLAERRRRTGDNSLADIDLGVEIKEKIDAFTAPYLRGKNLDPYVDKALRMQYVEKNGAFNEEWRKHAEDETRKAPTKEAELKEFFKKQNAEQQQLLKDSEMALKEKGLDNKFKQLFDTGPALIAGFVRDFFVQLVGGKSLARLQKPLAAERVAHLAKVLTAPPNEPNWVPPKEVPPMLDKIGKGSKNSDDSLNKEQSYAHFIHEIFQAQQSYHQKPEVGARFTPNFDKVRWDDDAIRKMNDDTLTPYEYAIKHITRRVMDKELAVSAILNFIGDNNGGRLVHADGQSFGPRGAGQDPADVKAAILKMIDDNTTAVRAEHSVTPEKMSEKMANWLFKVADVKQTLESKEGDPDWRVFTFKLFSKEVGDDVVVCDKLGIRSERCQELHKEVREFNEKLDGMLFVLGQKLEADPKNFDEMVTLTPSEKKLVAALNERLETKGGHVADLTYTPEETSALKTMALNIAMTVGKQDEFREDVKLAMEELKKPREIALQKERASEDHDHMRDSDRGSDRFASKDNDRDRDRDRARDSDRLSSKDRETDHDMDGYASKDRDGDRAESSRSSHDRQDSLSRRNSLDGDRQSEERTTSHADRVGKRLRVDTPTEDKYAGRHEKKRPVENRSGDGFSKRVQREDTETVRGGLS